MSGPESVTVEAPAKLNLDLLLRGRRPDGFHALETTLLALDRCDRLEVARTDSGAVALEVDGPAASSDVPADGRNLAWRAAAGLLEEARATGRASATDGLALRLTKHVPSGAGLGGGSADAAAAVLGGALLFDLDPDDPALLARLAGLGSDCAFFLAARATGAARCTGRGEQVEPLGVPRGPRAFVVLTPAVHATTAAVYAGLRPVERDSARAPLDFEAWLAADLGDARAALVNDLEASALRLHPELARWRTLLDDEGAGHFRLTGSGSSFFGLFAERPAAEAFLARLRASRKARDHGLRSAFVASARGAGVTG